MPLAVDGVKESTSSDLMSMISGLMALKIAKFGIFAPEENPSTTIRQQLSYLIKQDTTCIPLLSIPENHG